MTKIIKSKFNKQLKPYKIPKKNLNLLHKKCLYNSKNHNGIKIFQEQDALNLNNKDLLNNMKTKKKNKIFLKKPNVCDTELNTQTHEIHDASNISDASYNKNLDNFSSSMDYTTISCCNSKLGNSNSYTDSSTCKDLLECQKEHIYHRIKQLSRQRHITNLKKNQKNKFPRNQRDIVQTKSEDAVLEYSQKEKNNAATSYNYLLRKNSTERKQKVELHNLETNVQLNVQHFNILKPRTTENKTLTIPRKKRKQSSAQCNLELTCDRNDRKEENKIIVPNFHKENFTYDARSKKKCFLNSIDNSVKTRSMTRRENKELQKNVSLVSSTIDIPTAEFICMKKQISQKHQENISAFSFKNGQKEELLNENNETHVIEVEEETIFQRNLEMTTHFHSKSNTGSCNLRNNSFSNNKVLENNENQSLLSVQQHVKKKNQYEINKSIKIGKSGTNVHSRIEKKEIIKSECHIQLEKERQEHYGPLKKCERNAIETLKKTYITKTLESRNPEDSFKTATQTNRNNVKISENFVLDKKLSIPLIKLEDLTLSELSHQLYINYYTKNKTNNSIDNEAQYTVRNIGKTKCSVHKQYKVTKIRRNTKLNQICKSIKKCKNQNADDLYGSKGKGDCVGQKVNTELTTFVSTNQFSTKGSRKKEKGRRVSRNNISSSSTVEEYFTTEAACEQLSEDQYKLNMSLEEASNSQNQILGESSDYFNESMNNKMDTDIKNPEYKTNKCEISKNDKSNEAETLQNNKSELQTNQLLQNICNFFLENKKKEINSKTITKSEINYLKKEKGKIRKRVAVCIKCKQVLNLLQQFSDKTNFMKDEKLQIECTLCNVHISSLSHFQNHLMMVHLQCEGKVLSSENQFVVDVIDLNVIPSKKKENVNKFIFECCCCLKLYKNLCHFKDHIKKSHSNFNYSTNKTEKYKKKQVTETLEADTVNKNLIPDLINNTAEVCNEIDNNHIEEHCINKNNINVPDSSNLIVNAGKEQKEINETDISMNDISSITKSPYSDSTNDQNNQKHKEPDIFSKAHSYYCHICKKRYKRKHAFISHMSKHAEDSNNCIENVKEIQEILHDNNENKVKNTEHLPKTCTNNSDNYSDSYNGNDMSNSIVKENKLEERICNITTQKSNVEQIDNTKNDNIECIKEKVSEKETAFNYNYLLRVNCTEKLKSGVKKQKYIQGNVNISKKLKMENTKQQVVNNEMEDKLLISYTKERNFTFNTDTEEVKSYTQKEIRCNICNNKFNSQRMLKEHMFFLHDSILEDEEVSNLLLPYLNNHNMEKNVSTQHDANFEDKRDVSEEEMSEIFMEKGNKMYETIICKMFSKCSIDKKNKKWRCDLCKENFALIRNYLRHKYYIHNDTSVVHVCDNCNKVLTSVAMVNIHICSNVTSWNCIRCNLSFDNGISLMQHNINYHFEIAGPHICNVCSLEFLTVHMLEKHQSVHSTVNVNTNVNNFIDTSICIQNDLPYDSDNWEICGTEYEERNDHTMNKRIIPCINQNVKDLNNLTTASDTSLNEYTNSNISLESNVEETFKCKLCNVVFLTKKQLRFHFEKWHNLNAEICELCNRLYIADELTNHIINVHIVLSDFNLRESNIHLQLKYNNVENFQHNLVKLMGLKRLITLYEYQRFDIVPKEKYFNCVLCLTKFLNIQSYRIHYLRFHDTICLLCNTEFKNHYQAFEHKIKFHVSIDSYLWVIKKITTTILQSNEHESTLEDIILQCSETRIYDNERCTPDLFSLNNNKFNILDDKEFLHTSESNANSM
nr:protein PF14_0175-like [Nomia melanderi]